MASIALKSGLDIEIVDPIPSWPTVYFQGLNLSVPEGSIPRTATPDTVGCHRAPSGDNGDGDGVPSHVAQAIAELQRERLLLRSELNFELWMARENVKHIGRLYKDMVVNRNAEMERQALVKCVPHVYCGITLITYLRIA